jgi:hypothetical protein
MRAEGANQPSAPSASSAPERAELGQYDVSSGAVDRGGNYAAWGATEVVSRGRRPRATDEEIAAALRAANGVVAWAAVALRMSRKQLERRISRSPELQLVRDEARRRLAERALEKLDEHLEKGEPWAIRYVLAHVGHLVNWGTPPVRIAPHEDATAILARLDAIERELVGVEISLREYLALIELRRAAVADLRRASEIEPFVVELASEIARVVESTIEDPETRAELLRRLVEVLERGARGGRAQ